MVWQVKSIQHLQGPVTTAGGQKLGRVIDMSWVPMPHPISGGSAIAVATDDGAIALVDVAQSADQSSRRQRCANSPKLSVLRMVTRLNLQWLASQMKASTRGSAVPSLPAGPSTQALHVDAWLRFGIIASAPQQCRGQRRGGCSVTGLACCARPRQTAFRSLLGGTWPYPSGTLSPPPALGSALLMPPPWAQLLRLLLQQVATLALAVTSSPGCMSITWLADIDSEQKTSVFPLHQPITSDALIASQRPAQAQSFL